MCTTQSGAAGSWLNQEDINYFNRMLKDLCSAYKKYRDKPAEKQGGNFNALPHRIHDGIYSRFKGDPWPFWYATVALNSPQATGVGKRRLILKIRDHGDEGTVVQAVFSPTHYGDNKRQGVPDFVLLTGLTLNCNVGFSYKGNPPMVSLSVQPPSLPTPVVVAPPLVVGTGTPVQPVQDYVPDWVKELRRQTGDSYFTGSPDQFFRLQPTAD